MTGEVEIGATKDFILKGRGHLELALAVEAAMPAVRAELLESVLRGLEAELMKKFARGDWEVRSNARDNAAARYPWIGLRKKGWAGNKESAMPTAIVFQANVSGDWREMYLGLHCEDENAGENLARLQEMATKHLGDGSKSERNWAGWRFLQVPYRDWTSKEFLMLANNEQERAALVKYLAHEMINFANAVEDTLDA